MIVRQKLRYVAGRYLILTTYDTRSNAVLKLLSSFVLKKQDACWAYTPAILGVCRFAVEIDVGGLIYVEMICNCSNH